MSLALRGVLENAFGGFLCLRGFAPLGALAEHSVADYNNYQRPLDKLHRDKLVDYLNKKESRLFPELIFGVALGDDYGVPEESYNTLHKVMQLGEGLSRTAFGALTFSIFCKNFSPTNFTRPIHSTATVYGFESGEQAKIYRIDGNHRLEAVGTDAAGQAAKDLIVPFCVVFFRDKRHYNENAPLIFNDINFRHMPISEEINLSLILLKEKQDEEFLFSEAALRGMGNHFVLARQALLTVDQRFFPRMRKSIENARCCFFKNLFEWLEEAGIISSAQGFDSVKPYFTRIESVLEDAGDRNFGIASLGALSFYLIQEQMPIQNTKAKIYASKVDAFVAWLERNQLYDIDEIGMRELSSIYDRIYALVPKRVFLARWYPKSTDDQNESAKCRLSVFKKVVKDLGLELVDMGTRDTGTFSIRNEMFKELSECDIFVSDLTGLRHNVMVEVGYALHRINQGRMLFYFQKTPEYDTPPFDLSDFSYEEISDSSHIETKVKPRLETIIKLAAEGKI